MSMLTNFGKVAQLVVGNGPVMLLLVRNRPQFGQTSEAFGNGAPQALTIQPDL